MTDFFVVGVARSGTTLLRAMLTCHPDIAVPPESHFVPGLLNAFPDDVDWSNRPVTERFLRLLAAEDRFLTWRLDTEAVRASLERDPPASTPAAIERVYRLYAGARDKRVVGDKTPMYVRRISMLAGAWPDARFLHLIRDPRDVAASWTETSWGPDSLTAAAGRWRRWISTAREDARHLPEDRYHELRYEELTETPRHVLSAICEVLGVPYDGRMLDYTEHTGQLLAQLPHPQDHTGLRRDPGARRDWRRELSPWQVAVIEAVSRPVLEQLGYAPHAQVSGDSA